MVTQPVSKKSLDFSWQPLPESEYNGNPESVGYRVKAWRADQRGEVSTRLVNDRLEREITLEGLEEWTEYQLQIQAFNSIGPGPWSDAVKGRTRESGEGTRHTRILRLMLMRVDWSHTSMAQFQKVPRETRKHICHLCRRGSVFPFPFSG